MAAINVEVYEIKMGKAILYVKTSDYPNMTETQVRNLLKKETNGVFRNSVNRAMMTLKKFDALQLIK